MSLPFFNMKIKEILLEVKIIPQAMSADEMEPLRESDTVLLYHGTNDINTIIGVSKYGLSGDTRAKRIYSYEFNNNPKGLFVTPDFKTAKEFGDYIIELHCRVSDLDAPVWPGGGFTVQGQMSQYFNDEDDRKNAQMQRRQEYSRESEPDYIRLSDRPELAATLMAYGERQALFVGDLNANSVRAIWVSSDPTSSKSKYIRYSVPEFKKKLSTEGIPTRYKTIEKNFNSDEHRRELQNKLIKPRDYADLDTLIKNLQKEYPTIDRDSIIEILMGNPDYVRRYVWSDRQAAELTKQLQDAKQGRN